MRNPLYIYIYIQSHNPLRLYIDEDEGIQLRGQSYTKYLDTQLNKCLVRLVNNHRLRVQKPDVSRLLRDHAVDKEVACFALQVHGNNFDATRGWLQRYSSFFSPFCARVRVCVGTGRVLSLQVAPRVVGRRRVRDGLGPRCLHLDRAVRKP